MSLKLYKALGPEQSTKAFVFYPAHTYPGQEQELQDNLNPDELQAYPAVAVTGEGVFETLRAVSKAVIKTLS